MRFWQDAVDHELQSLLDNSRLGLVTDVDGTISPIVDDPDAARVTPRNLELLAALRERLCLVAVISGRAAADIHARVGLDGVVYVGNHGLERWRAGSVDVMPEVARYREALAAAVTEIEQYDVDGLWVEDKRATLSIHYRQTENPAAIAADFRPIVAEVAARHDLKLFDGNRIFELRPPIEANKGTAFGNLLDEYQLDAALYLGDDVTDADAMHVARERRASGDCYALAIAVVSESMPDPVAAAADLFTAGVSGVESFLSWLLRASSASST